METNEEILRKLYLGERLTTSETANKLGWNEKKVINALHKFGIRKHDLGKILPIEKIKLAYLAGIFDGEGSLYVLKRNNRLKIVFDIGMTDKNTIETIYKWLTSSGFHPKFKPLNYKGTDKRGYDRTKWKKYYRVTLYWMQEIKKLLELILPLVINKQELCKLGIQYINMRNGWGKKYTPTDFELANKIIEINRKRGHKNGT